MKNGFYQFFIFAITFLLLSACVEWNKLVRIQSFLDQGVIPIIDMESTLPEDQQDSTFPAALSVMDNLAISQIAFEGAQAAADPTLSGYRWSTYINKLVADYPDYLFLTANGGSNNNWANQNGGDNSYITQLEQAIHSGRYALMGELEFRHYMSVAQCQQGKTHRDVSVPIDSANGHRVFQLAQQSGVPFVIHYEPEDALIPALEYMLASYPRAKVIWAHFGQLRNPALMTQFSPAMVERLLTMYPNLYFDLATGNPNRYYYCVTGVHDTSNGILDTVIWESDSTGAQTDTLKHDYRELLERFNHRFVSAMDYGGSRPQFEDYYTARTNNLRLIMRDLSLLAKHNISYRNAWYLLTGSHWIGRPVAPEVEGLYLIDAHSQADSQDTLTRILPLMKQAGVRRTILSGRRQISSTDTANFADLHPLQIIPALRTKGRPYIDNTPAYYTNLQSDVASGRFSAMAELLVYHAQKGDLAEEVMVPPNDPRVQTALQYAKQQAWPLVVHIEFAALQNLQNEARREFMRQFEQMLFANPEHPFALIHMGQLTVGEVRRLIHRHPNVYFLTSHTNPEAINSSDQPWTPMFDGDVLTTPWRALVIAHPDRFILAFDNVWPEQWGDFYLNQAGYWHSALAQLPAAVAHALAHANAERLWPALVLSPLP